MTRDEARAYRVRSVREGLGFGWAFTPLNGKVPTLEGWSRQGRVPDDRALEWAEAGNVGLRTGSISGVFVIDVDAGGDVSGLNLPETPVVETPGGGRHYYFIMPDAAIGNSAGRLGPKIDTRGEGGQVVFPGSIHPTGGVYRWADGLSPLDVEGAEVPENILAALTQKPQAVRRPTGTPIGTPAGANLTRYVARAVEAEIEAVRGAGEGSRNDTLNRAAFNLGQLIGSGSLDRDVARQALTDAGLSVGLGAIETERTVASGLAAGEAEPRTPRGRPRKARSTPGTGQTPRPTPARAPEAPEAAPDPVEGDEGPAADPDDPGPAVPEGADDRDYVLTPGAYVTAGGDYVEVGHDQFVADVLSRIPGGALYRRAGTVGELRDGAFAPVDRDRLRAIVDNAVRLSRWTRPRNGNPERIYTPTTADLAGVLLSCGQTSGEIRRLDVLTNYPVYFGDDYRRSLPGWNPGANAVYVETPDLVGLTPTVDELQIRAVLEDLVADFPFATEIDRVNFYGLMLTPILRPAIDGNVPLHLIASSMARTGKTKLAEEVLGGVVLGRPTPAIQIGASDEEQDKRILAILRRGGGLVHFDNLRAYVDSPSLASLVTATTYSGRILARTEVVEVPNDLTIVLSGNNIKLSEELAKRTVPIVLQPTTDSPENRTDFDHPDIRAYVRRNRPNVLAALVGMVDRWKGAGMPLSPKPMGGFERWSAVVGGVLEASGFEGWRDNQNDWTREVNDLGEDLRILVDIWATRYPGEQRFARDVYQIAVEADLFANVLTGKTDHGRLVSFTRRVLNANKNRPVGGYILRAQGFGSTTRWSIVER